MESTTTKRIPLVANFAAHGDRLAAGEPPWARRLRRDACARFEALGIPTTRLEAWRTTNVTSLATEPFEPAPAVDPARIAGRLGPVAETDLGGPRLVFVDGRHCPELSSDATLPRGVWLGSLRHALESIPDRIRPALTRRDPKGLEVFEALNAAFFEDGAVVLVDADVDAGPPIHLVFAGGGHPRPTAFHARNLIVGDRGSRVRVVETFVGTGDDRYFNNTVTDVVAGDGARVDHARIQLEGVAALQVSTVHSRQTRDSTCVLHNIDLGARLARHDVLSVLDGEGADCRLHGLYITRDEQHVDSHTVLDHARPHGSSRELYKGLLDGRSRAVFNGRIVVRRDAQQTDAKQSNPNLLLSSGALAHTRPQLEIYADDVKCTHGATIGRLDEDAVFYLRTRGIADADARHLMTTAFAGEMLDRLDLVPLRPALERAIADRLPRADGERTDG